MIISSSSNAFTVKESIKSLVNQLRICKKKSTNVTPLPAYIGRKPATTLSSISTTPNSPNLTYEQISNQYLDAATDPVDEYCDVNGWVSIERSDILIEETMTLAQVDAGRHFNGLQYKSVSRFISIICSQNQLEKDFGIETGTRSSETLKERSSRFMNHTLT